MPGKPPGPPGGYMPDTGDPGGTSEDVSVARVINDDSKPPGNGI
jgi:hypothetical protein